MEYCEKHKNDTPPEIERPLKSANLAEIVEPYDAKFVDLENLEELFEIILAANYLDIKSLLELSCAKVASLIKGNYIHKYICHLFRSIGLK
jgi:S-phase kinase-associated protein 1